MTDLSDPKDQHSDQKSPLPPLSEQEKGQGRRERIDTARDRRQSKQQLKRWMRDYNLEDDDFDWDDEGEY